MKKGLLTTLIVVVLVGTVSLAAFAYGNGRGRSGDQMGKPGFFQNLNLSPEQQQKLLEVKQDYQRETQSLRFEMQKKQLELRQLWSASTLNRSAIEAKEKEVTGIRVQLVTKARAMQDKMKSILTAEQLKKLEEYGFNRNSGAGVRGRRGGKRMGCSCGS